MRQEKAHKIKILKLWEILSQETDIDNKLSTVELIEKLGENGIECDRRTIYDDIKVLNEYGYEVMQERGKANAYYVEDRSFDVPELKILIDAVQASSFITKKKTKELIEKIAALGGSNRARLLKKNSVEYNTKKHSNESIYYTVNAIDEAIHEKRKLRFKYFETDISKNRHLRKNGDYYIVNPCCMIYDNNNYYLVCYDDKHRELSHYRLDRMLDASKADEKITLYDNLKTADVKEHIREVFDMYTGEKTEIKFRADNSLIDAVVDKFGENVNFLNGDEKNFEFYANVQLSPTFYGWCFSLGGKLKIIAPGSAVREYESRLRNVLDGMTDGAKSE